MFKLLGRILNIIAEVLAIVLVAVFIVLAIDANYPFISNVPVVYNVFKGLFFYGVLVLIGVVGLAAVLKHKLVFVLIFLAVFIVAVVFMFLPGTLTQLIGLM